MLSEAQSSRENRPELRRAYQHERLATETLNEKEIRPDQMRNYQCEKVGS